MESGFASAYSSVEGLGAEVTFLNGAFEFLAQNSTFLDQPKNLKLIHRIATRHCKAAQDRLSKEREQQERIQQEEEDDGVIELDRSESNAPTVDVAPSKKVEKVEEEEEEQRGPAPVGNGGCTDKYWWTQTLSEVNVMLKLPAGTKGRDVSVQIMTDRLHVQIKGEATPTIDGQLKGKVKPDDSTWTIETEQGDRVLTVYLPKLDGMNWWDCVIVGDPTINTRDIVPENSKLDDLDRDTRQTVEKMMFDQRQKAMGKPTSEESRKQEMLQKFMAQHPEMDFSKAKMM